MNVYIEKNKNNGIDYLRLVKSQRIVNSKGIKTSTKSVVYNIGPLSRFDDGNPDYVERLKQSFKQGKPIIPELQHFCTDPLPIIQNCFHRYLSKEYLKNWV